MSRAIGKFNRSPGTVPAEKIRNIGPKSAAWLRQVGIRSTAEIQALGAFGVFLKVRKAGFKAGLNLLYALAGAQDGCHWQALQPERKAGLLLAFSGFEAEQKAARKIFAPRNEAAAQVVERALGKSEASEPVAD